MGALVNCYDDYVVADFLIVGHNLPFELSMTKLIRLVLVFPLIGSHGWLISELSAQAFPLVSADELKMTSEPLAPGAPAIILQRRDDRDDERLKQSKYFRIKVLTDAGREQANIEIPFNRGYVEVKNIRARTVGPDGSITDFNGQIYERELAKGKWGNYAAKVFILPDVRVGSVLEYSYDLDLKHYPFDASWILNSDLFTRKAQFSFKPDYRPTLFRRSLELYSNITTGVEPTEDGNHVFRMEMTNIPAFVAEEYMPPENELKSRIDFRYVYGGAERDPDKFWKRVGSDWYLGLERFLGKSKAMEEALRQIILPDDPPETKLRKIYARVQALRNTSFDPVRTEKEEKRDNEKPAQNVSDIWKRGYGSSAELPWLFLGLVRAAGFEAYGCWVSDRSEYFFYPQQMQSDRLRNNVVLVKLDGKELFLDPGAAFAPFGVLPWMETSSPGLRLDSAGGSWIHTPLPSSSESQVRHSAKLTLVPGGGLEGWVTVSYTGLEAMHLRVTERNSDQTGRKGALEELLRNSIPQAAEVNLTNRPDWDNAEAPLIAEFTIKIPTWTASAGHRILVPLGIFSAAEKRIFENAERIHPIYFAYPYGELDDIAIELPDGWQTAALPQSLSRRSYDIVYSISVSQDKRVLRIKRELNSDIYRLGKERYPALQGFFQGVRIGDGQDIVVEPGTHSAAKLILGCPD